MRFLCKTNTLLDICFLRILRKWPVGKYTPVSTEIFLKFALSDGYFKRELDKLLPLLLFLTNILLIITNIIL